MSKQRRKIDGGGSHAQLCRPVAWLAEPLERRLLLSAYAFRQIVSFPSGFSEDPSAVVLDAEGNLYGATVTGPGLSTGTIYEIAKGSSATTTLASFYQNIGSFPTDLTLDAAGNLFGSTEQGGSSGNGTVFEIAKGSNTITTIATFDGANGGFPQGKVAIDAAGDLFGTTEFGGSGNGTVFEIAKGSTTITTLVSFPDANGNEPNAFVALDRTGNLYSTTISPIPVEQGYSYSVTIFELASGSKAMTTLCSFDYTTTSQAGPGALTLDAAGDLYDTIPGMVFELAAGSNTITPLASFDSGLGGSGGVRLDGAGNLFGTTQYGSGYGNVFEIAKGSSAMTTIYSFSGSDGEWPVTALTLDSAGNLYGTTMIGGSGNNGTVFELSPNTTASVTLAGGTNPSNAAQSLNFTATVQPTSPATATVPNGETMVLVDASNNYAVVATGTLNNDSATLTVPVGTLRAGTHNLVAVYVGDANFGASQSAPYLQTVQLVVLNLKVNGNIASLAGVQRSMVDSILYTFSEPVELSGNAATLAIEAGQIGTLPASLTWTAIAPRADGSSAQWAVTFSGNGVTGGSIANGVYDIALNSSDVSSDANPSVNVQTRPTDTFYRLFGDINGDGVVNATDNFRLKAAMSAYNAAFDYNDSGVVNAADNFQFKADQSISFAGVGTTI